MARGKRIMSHPPSARSSTWQSLDWLKSTLWLSAILWLTVLSPNPSWGQDPVGNWQGTLSEGTPRRLILKLSRSNLGELQGQLYLIDQGSGSIPIPDIDARGAQITISSIPAMGATFKGTISSDGLSMSGKWEEIHRSVSLTLVRATPETAWPLPVNPGHITPMDPDVHPNFEVATIKENYSKHGVPWKLECPYIATSNVSMLSLIQIAFGMNSRQIVGGPDWVRSENVDIAGLCDAPGRPNPQQLAEMYRKLLTERCSLTIQHDKRSQLAYVLVAAQGPTKL